jgi:hypothetical protein
MATVLNVVLNVSMTLYLIPAILVFRKALQAFLQDESTPKTHLYSWVMVAVVALLWPLTLPAIAHKQYFAIHPSEAGR